jgi:hypothetical protein
MKKFYQLLVLCFFIIGCEKEGIQDTSLERNSTEENILEKGISLEELRQSSFVTTGGFKSFLSSKNPNSETELNINDLADRLDLSESYWVDDKTGTVLMAPIRTAGNFKRNLVSIRNKEISLDFTITYPDPNNKNHFYVTNLRSMHVQEIKIGENGRALDLNNNFAKSGGCYTEVYKKCTSGQHSFNNPASVWECQFWKRPSAGTPPQLFRVAGSCDAGTGGGYTGGSPGGTGGGGSTEDPSGGGSSGGGGSTTIPPGDTNLSPITQDCLENLDCEDCNLPGDLNNDCQLSSEEVLFPQLNLDRRENSWLLKTATSVQQQLLIQHLLINSSSQEAKDFAVEVVRTWMAGGEVDFEEQILNHLSGKALNVYNQLKSSSIGFTNAIKKFEPDFPVAHLRFDMADIGTSRGRTIAPNSNPGSPNSPNFVITIRLNNNDTDNGVNKRPNLLVAKTIAHEVIHAEMFRKMLSVLDNGGTITGVTRQQLLDALIDNFPGIYEYYRNHKNWQHQQMANHYRDVLARILQEFDTGNAVPDSQQPAQLYMDLSWEGLRYPNIYIWTSLPQIERNRINKVISDYIDDNSN